jgi:small-conductance mechanosensitive channel
MPRVARTFIKTGLVYFLCALLLGIAIEIKSFHFAAVEVLFWHLLMVGWITQIIFGVSMWMFPGRTREEGFTAQKKAWLTYYFLNIGLILRVITEPMLTYSSLRIWHILIVFSAVLQLLAIITYVFELWPRIQSKKKLREKRKKKRRK